MERPRSLALTCRRCGTEIRQESTGRRRQFCGAACRQAGNRLRAVHGEDWWHRQSWYPAWRDAWDEWNRAEAAGRAAAKAARERERQLLESMPADVRAGAEAARRARFERGLNQFSLTAARLEADALAAKYEKELAAEGYAIQMLPAGRSRVEHLLWAAASTDSEAEAAAMLAKARTLVASGEASGAPEAQLSVREHLRRMVASM